MPVNQMEVYIVCLGFVGVQLQERIVLNSEIVGKKLEY